MYLNQVAAAALLPLVAIASPALEERQFGWGGGGFGGGGNTGPSTTSVTVNLEERFQEIDGFGFSEAFQRANGIVNLPEPKRTEVLDLLFNTTTGAGMTIVRNGIGSSPSSANDWMNTFMPDSPGSPDAEPVYEWDGKDSGQLWVSQQAVRYGVKTFYGNAWSAPGFMKSNGRDSGGGCLCGSPGCSCASGDWRQAYADYLVKYVELYASEGVAVTHIGFVNEPDISTSYASMQVNGEQAADFVKVLRPALDAANMSGVKIACCEATGWSVQRQYTQALAGVSDMMDVITSHEYTSRISGEQPTELKVWETEYSDLSGGWSTAWYSNGGAGDGWTWANTISNGLTSGNLNAYLFWEGTQDRATNNNNNEKLILVEATTYQVSKRLWAFAQFSRTVRPGAIRIGTTGGEGLRVTAFENLDGSVAVNMINSGSGVVTIEKIDGVEVAAARAWVTDNDHDMELTETGAGSGGVTGIEIPGRGMVSVVIRRV